MEERKLVNILDEIRDRLYLAIEYCADHELDVWEQYFVPLREKNEDVYEAYLKVMVSDSYEITSYLMDCKEQDLADEQVELRESLHELETFDRVLIEIETNQDFFHQLLLQFSNRYEYRKGFLVGAFNHVFHHYYKQMIKLNNLYIYEVNYATIMCYTYRQPFKKQDFINIYEHLETLEKQDEEYDLNEEYELFFTPLIVTNPKLFTEALHSMIESFYIYCTIGIKHGYIKEGSMEMELYHIIEEGDYHKVFSYLNDNMDALHLLFTCFHAQHLSDTKLDVEEFNNIADAQIYSRVRKMINKRTEDKE